MKIFVAIAYTITVALGSTLCLADERKLELASTDFPPYYGTELENGGFITEIVVEASKRAGYEVEITFLPWKRAIADAKAGKYDGIVTLWYRKEREEWFVYSDPLPPTEYGFYKRKDRAISFETGADLKAFTIGVARGYGLPPVFEEWSLTTEVGKDEEQNLRKLQKGRIDLAFVDKVTAQHLIRTRIPEGAADMEWLDPPLVTEFQFVAFSKQTSDFGEKLADFNRGLAEINEDGTLKEIIAKHGF